MERITWKFVEETMFPLVVKDARRAGLDADRWALASADAPGRAFCHVHADTKARTVWHWFERPEHADRFFQGVRWALSHLPTDKADAIREALEYLAFAPDDENVNKASDALMAVHGKS